MKKILSWLSGLFKDEKGTPSSKRVMGVICTLTLCVTMYANQYTEELFKLHYRGSHEGKRLTGEPEGEQTFTFRTGPETKMIHLVLFREGTHDRNSLMFDDIEIKASVK